MNWVKLYDQTLVATPNGSGYLPISPVILPEIRSPQLVFKAVSTEAKPTWRKAFDLVQLVELPGQMFGPVEALRTVIPLNKSVLVTPVSVDSYSLKIEVPYWISTISIEMWGGSAGEGSAAGHGAAAAAANIERGQAIYLLPSGQADLAQANSTATGGVVGFAANAATIGTSASFFTEGVLSLEDWSAVAGTPGLTPGRPYYLSPEVPGQITLNPPQDSGLLVVRVGQALSSSALDIEIQLSFLL